MRIVSYNVNGIRAAANKGLFDWIAADGADVVLFQEVKAEMEQLDPAFYTSLGYQCAWHSAEKKGYSGVAIFYKKKPNHIEIGCGNPLYDREGRILRIDYDEVSILSVYLPSGTSGDERQAFKMETLSFFSSYINDLKSKLPALVIGGDFNICRQPIDIHDPVRNKDISGFKPEERAWVADFLELGLTDSFRHLHPEEAHRYSWWTFRANARGNNKGWRIDYLITTQNISDKITSANIHPDAVHSDHCPVSLELSL